MTVTARSTRFASLPATPLSRVSIGPKTGGFASPPRGGFALTVRGELNLFFLERQSVSPRAHVSKWRRSFRSIKQAFDSETAISYESRASSRLREPTRICRVLIDVNADRISQPNLLLEDLLDHARRKNVEWMQQGEPRSPNKVTRAPSDITRPEFGMAQSCVPHKGLRVMSSMRDITEQRLQVPRT
jgi:hypothetical protein